MDAPDRPPHNHKKRKRRSARCAECYRRKAKCSDRFPCDRCFAECHPCEPPADLLAPGQPLLDLAIRTNDPRAVNEAYLQAFYRLQKAGRTRVERAKLALRGWRSMVIGRGVDITHGLLDALTLALGLSAADVEPQAHAHAHVGGEWRPEGAQAREELSRGALAGEQTRMLDDRATMVFGCRITERGHFTSVSEAGARTLCSTADLYRYSDQHQMLNMHILCSMVAPEDRVAALEATLDSFFNCEPRCSLIKFCNRDGDIDLYIFKVRVTPHAAGPGLPSGLTMLGFLERAPASKHVSRRPGHRHRIVGSLRHDWSKAASSSQTSSPPHAPSSCAAPLPTLPPPLPGLACLPVRAIPEADLQALLLSPQAFPPCGPTPTPALPCPPLLRGKRRHISASSDTDSAADAGDSSAVPSSEGGAASPASPSSTSTSTSAVPPLLLYLPLPTLGSGRTSGASTSSSPGRPTAMPASTSTSTSTSGASALSLGGLEGAPLPALFAQTAAVFTPPVVCGGFDMATILTATATTTTTISVSVAQAQLQAAGAGQGPVGVGLGLAVKPEVGWGVGEEGIDDDILQALLDPSLLPDPQ